MHRIEQRATASVFASSTSASLTSTILEKTGDYSWVAFCRQCFPKCS